MAFEEVNLKCAGTILRMDKRICQVETQCPWYDAKLDGFPCTECFDQCEYLQKKVDEKVSEIELELRKEYASEITDMSDQIDSRESQISDLKRELKNTQELLDKFQDLSKDLKSVRSLLGTLKKD